MAKDRYSTLGSKLGPRLADIWARTQTATERNLLGTKHQLGMAIFESASKMIGREFSAASGDLLEEVAGHPDLPRYLADPLRLAAAGQGQGGAILGSMILGSGTGNSLGTIFSNGLYPAVAAIVGRSPNLPPSPETLAAMAAHGVIDYGHAQGAAEGQGRPSGWFEAEVEAARAWPDVSVVLELLRRGQIDGKEASRLLGRIGLPAEVFGGVLSLRRQHLAPADAALGLLRGTLDKQRADNAAHAAGLNNEDFQTLVDNTGEPPGLQDLLMLWRRGKIDTAKLNRGIRQSRVRDEWIGTIHELGVMPPSPNEVLAAYLEGQIGRGEAEKRWKEAGGDPSWFQHAYDATGQAPSPNMLAELANRGVIGWKGKGPKSVSFEQGFLEGPWRNKWLEPMRKLAEYLPPPRTITAMVKEGALTHKQATKFLMDQGLTHELATAYVTGATSEKVKPQKELAAGQIATLYQDQAIDRTQAIGMWEDLGYEKHEANFLAVLAEFARVQHYTTTAISTIHSRYTGHVIERETASNDLDALSVPSSQRDSLLGLWDLERQAKVKLLTAAEVKKAVHKELLSEPEAMARLLKMGYPQQDAEIYLKL